MTLVRYPYIRPAHVYLALKSVPEEVYHLDPVGSVVVYRYLSAGVVAEVVLRYAFIFPSTAALVSYKYRFRFLKQDIHLFSLFRLLMISNLKNDLFLIAVIPMTQLNIPRS
jgi:hypothetical protein